MLLALFGRKASCIDDLNFNNRAEFLKKYGKKVIIEKEITFTEEQYEKIINNLDGDYGFIEENKNLMYTDQGGVWHCILIRNQYNPHAILINSEGYSYARYAAIYQNCN